MVGNWIHLQGSRARCFSPRYTLWKQYCYKRWSFRIIGSTISQYHRCSDWWIWNKAWNKITYITFAGSIFYADCNKIVIKHPFSIWSSQVRKLSDNLASLPQVKLTMQVQYLFENIPNGPALNYTICWSIPNRIWCIVNLKLAQYVLIFSISRNGRLLSNTNKYFKFSLQK